MTGTRQEQLLKLVIENYIKTALPIGSRFLAEISDLGLSGATIRNELNELEQQGFLTHPHTSAGRIPTEDGYRHYVEHMEERTRISKNFQETVETIKNQGVEGEQLLKELGKESAAFSQNAVIIAFTESKIYYTGISYLFSQPEFENSRHTIEVSAILDHCEEHVPELFERTPANEEKIFIGAENPLGAACSTVAVRVNVNSLFAVVGPMRMDYKKNIGMVQYLKNLF